MDRKIVYSAIDSILDNFDRQESVFPSVVDVSLTLINGKIDDASVTFSQYGDKDEAPLCVLPFSKSRSGFSQY